MFYPLTADSSLTNKMLTNHITSPIKIFKLSFRISQMHHCQMKELKILTKERSTRKIMIITGVFAFIVSSVGLMVPEIAIIERKILQYSQIGVISLLP